MAIYLVSRDGAEEGEKPRLIEARTKTQAISFAARNSFAAQPLSTKEAFTWGAKGIELEDASADSE